MNNINEFLRYEKDTGEFFWIKKPSKNMLIGSSAGHTRKDGYINIHYKNKSYYAHHLAWLFVYGFLPKCGLDHIDQNPINNRIENLRYATDAQNQQNKSNPRIDNKSGYLGVSFCSRSNKWRANIKVNKKQKFLGYFESIKQASDAYITEKRKIHPFWVEKQN